MPARSFSPSRARSFGRMPWHIGAWLACGWVVAACASKESPRHASTRPTTTAPGAPAAEPAAPSPAPSEDESAPAPTPNRPSPPPPFDLYDPDTIPHFELTVDGAAVVALSSLDPNEKSWLHGSFKYGNVSFADVGVRRKGASTLRALPQKASFKVKFNKWVKGQKLYGLEEITLNNMVSDPTYLAERLTYHVFRALGLPAQRANTAHLTFNGDDFGIYANVETPDEEFLARVFGGKAKTLYEVNSGSNWLPGNAGGFDIDVADPAAPLGERPDVDQLFQAVLAANNASLIEDLDAHLHTKQWLRHSAAEAVTGHFDGYAYGVWGSHNYFMAGDTDGKFSLIPWSADLSLSDREGVPNAATPRPTVVLARCKLGARCWDAYKAEVASALEVYETLDLVNLAMKWHEQIAALAEADPKREQSLTYHARETEALYGWLKARPGVVRAQLGL